MWTGEHSFVSVKSLPPIPSRPLAVVRAHRAKQPSRTFIWSFFATSHDGRDDEGLGEKTDTYAERRDGRGREGFVCDVLSASRRRAARRG